MWAMTVGYWGRRILVAGTQRQGEDDSEKLTPKMYETSDGLSAVWN